ncbi:MAG: glycosyltransferase family 2 protein [Acidobacteria bacterium]|nr:glycosyltransferase family 2 protein [Acidobacteriota bacterium]
MIAALIPAYGAAATISKVVRESLPHVGEVLVVDDGSTDASGEVARAAGAAVVRHEMNLGKGAALATGFSRLLARGASAIVTLDADGQHDPAEIPAFVRARRESAADLVVGARVGAWEAMSGARRFGNRFSCAAVRFFRGPALPDTQCGFRLYTRELLEAVSFRRRSYDAEVEILMLAGLDGFRVVPLPIRVLAADGRATSHYRPWLDTYRMCRTVVVACLSSSHRGAHAQADRDRVDLA